MHIKHSRRWLNFQNAIQGMGYNIKFEHIEGKDNILADILSRKFAGKIGKETLLLEEILQPVKIDNLKHEFEISQIQGYDSLKINEFEISQIQGYGSLKTKIYCLNFFRKEMASSSKPRMTAREFREKFKVQKAEALHKNPFFPSLLYKGPTNFDRLGINFLA